MANKPNNPTLWSKAKSLAKQKFDVYPSAYANGWAAKWYKSKGGTWSKAQYGMEVMGDGGAPDNPGFRALPPAVQQKILSNMAYGGYPFMQQGGEPDGAMALGQIDAAMDKLSKLRQFIQPDSDLEPWVSSKLTLMDHYTDAVSDYMMYNPEAQGEMMAPEEMKEGGIPQRYKNMGFNKVGVKKDSTRPGKKWMVLAKKGDQYKVVHGGYTGMKDYTQHGSEKRRENFWNRMGGKNSAKATDPFSPLYWHKRFGTWQEGGEINMPEMKAGGSTWSGNAWYQDGGEKPTVDQKTYEKAKQNYYRLLDLYGQDKLANIDELNAMTQAHNIMSDNMKFYEKGKYWTTEPFIDAGSQLKNVFRKAFNSMTGNNYAFGGYVPQYGMGGTPCYECGGMYPMGGYIPTYQDAGQVEGVDFYEGQLNTPAKPTYAIGSAKDPSVVNYLASRGLDHRKEARAKMAKEFGIENYTGTAAQNAQLLAKLRTAESAASRAGSSVPVDGKQIPLMDPEQAALVQAYQNSMNKGMFDAGQLNVAKPHTPLNMSAVEEEMTPEDYPYVMRPPVDSTAVYTPGQDAANNMLPYMVGAAGLGTLGYQGYRAGMTPANLAKFVQANNAMASQLKFPAVEGIYQVKMTPEQIKQMNKARNQAIKEFIRETGVASNKPSALRAPTVAQKNKIVGEAMEQAYKSSPSYWDDAVRFAEKVGQRMLRRRFQDGSEVTAEDNLAKKAYDYMDQNNILDHVWKASMIGASPAEKAVWQAKYGKRNPLNNNPYVETAANIGQYFIPYYGTGLIGSQVGTALASNNLDMDDKAAEVVAAALPFGAGMLAGKGMKVAKTLFKKEHGGIHINPANKGKFTTSAKRAGMGVQEFAAHVLANKEDYSSTQVKRANFARNAAKWRKQDGGPVEGDVLDVTPEELERLRQMGYQFEMI